MEEYNKTKDDFWQLRVSNFIEKYIDHNVIFGPSSVSTYRYYDSYFVFFGDIHMSPTKKCISYGDGNKSVWIEDFLDDLFKISPTCIDFMVETTMFQQIKKKLPGQEQEQELSDPGVESKSDIDTYDPEQINKLLEWKKEIRGNTDIRNNVGLARIQKKFVDCLGPIKITPGGEKCVDKYKKVRFHNIEYRRFLDTTYNISMGGIGIDLPIHYMSCPIGTKCDYKNLKGSFMNLDNKMIKERYDTNIINYIKNVQQPAYINIINGLLFYKPINLAKGINSIVNYFTNPDEKVSDEQVQRDALKIQTDSQYYKIFKQIDKLNENLARIFIRKIMERFRLIILIKIKTLQKIVNEHPNSDSMDNKTFIKFKKLLFDVVLNMGTLIVDTYALARMLQAVFTYRKTSLNDNNTSLFIVYAGDNHTKFQLEFLVEFFREKDSDANDDEIHDKYNKKIEKQQKEIDEFMQKEETVEQTVEQDTNSDEIQQLPFGCLDKQQIQRLLLFLMTPLSKIKTCAVNSGINIETTNN